MPVELISPVTEAHIADLHALYQQTWWADRRQLANLPKMLAHSDVALGLIDTDTGRLIGFSRVLTDFIYRATIYDVMVANTHQQQGLGRRLIEAILAHPDLQEVTFFDLTCLPDMIPFYEQWDFTANMGDIHLMRYTRPGRTS